MANLSYANRARAVRRSRGRRFRSPNSSGASTLWSAGWTDPFISLTPGVTGSIIAIDRPELDENEEVTLVGGFIQTAGYISSATGTNSAGGYLIMAARVQPETITTIAESPDPFNQDDGDWFWYRTFPLIDNGNPGSFDQCNSYAVNDQIRSARRIPQDSVVAITYTFLDADVSGVDAVVNLLLSWRLLLRVP